MKNYYIGLPFLFQGINALECFLFKCIQDPVHKFFELPSRDKSFPGTICGQVVYWNSTCNSHFQLHAPLNGSWKYYIMPVCVRKWCFGEEVCDVRKGRDCWDIFRISVISTKGLLKVLVSFLLAEVFYRTIRQQKSWAVLKNTQRGIFGKGDPNKLGIWKLRRNVNCSRWHRTGMACRKEIFANYQLCLSWCFVSNDASIYQPLDGRKVIYLGAFLTIKTRC